MPFAIVRLPDGWGIMHLQGPKAGEVSSPRFRSEETAARQAARWMAYRGHAVRWARKRGTLLALHA